MQQKDTRIYFRTSADVKEKIQAIANAEGITLSNYLDNLIKKDLAERDAQKPKAVVDLFYSLDQEAQAKVLEELKKRS